MPRLFGRLWRSGARRAEPAGDDPAAGQARADAGEGRKEIGRRLEAARERLRQTIPPPEEEDRPQT